MNLPNVPHSSKKDRELKMVYEKKESVTGKIAQVRFNDPSRKEENERYDMEETSGRRADGKVGIQC